MKWTVAWVLTAASLLGREASSQPRTVRPGPYLFVLDLQGTPLDEFPSAVKALNGVMTVVDKDGQHMLMATSPSELLITLARPLPADFTIELDFIPKGCCAPDDITLEGMPARNRGVASAELTWHPSRISAVGGGGQMYQSDMPADLAASTPDNLTHVVVEFQGARINLYTNGRRLYTLEKQFVRGRVLRVGLGGESVTNPMYLAGLRIGTEPVGPGVIATRDGSGGGVSPNPPNNPPRGASDALPGSVEGISVAPGAQGPIVNWAPVAVNATYSVKRWSSTDPACCNAASPTGLNGPPWQDAPLPGTGTYVYEVTATFTGGSATGQARFTNLLPAGAGGSIQQTSAAGAGASGSTGGLINTGGSLVKPPGSPTPIVLNDATPPSVTVTPVPAGLKVSWDAVAGANQYPVCRESPPGSQCVLVSFPGATVGGNTISQVELGLSPGSTHAYRVSALRPDHHYGQSGPVTGTAGALPAPTNLRALQVTTAPALVLAWDPIQYTEWNGLKTLTTYQVTGTGLTTPQVVNGTQVTLPLPNGPGAYTWQVASIIPNPAGGWAAGTPPAAFTYDFAPKYRLVALGVKALKQSADDIFAVDGISDEIYVAAIANTTTRSLSGSSVGVARSNTYGDIGTGNAFPGRVQGGTASPRGGIRSGDMVPITLNPSAATGSVYTTGFPLVLWEGRLDDNAMVVVSPSLWEEDVDKKLYAPWESAIRAEIQSGYPKGLASLITGLRDQDALGPAVRTGALLWCGWCVNGVDRPVGLQLSTGATPSDPANYFLSHQVLVLTRTAIERALTGPAQVAGGLPGTFVMSMFENAQLMSAMYELYLRVERAP
jgi:hypothetical protein